MVDLRQIVFSMIFPFLIGIICYLFNVIGIQFTIFINTVFNTVLMVLFLTQYTAGLLYCEQKQYILGPPGALLHSIPPPQKKKTKKIPYISGNGTFQLILKKFLCFFKRKLFFFLYFSKWNTELCSPSLKNKRNPPRGSFLHNEIERNMSFFKTFRSYL